MNQIDREIDLSGIWKLHLDPEGVLKSPPEAGEFKNTIQLPGDVAGRGFGEKPSMRTKWIGDGWKHPQLFPEWQTDDNFKMPFFLMPDLHYIGVAWYSRTIDISSEQSDKTFILNFERVHWQSKVWIDGKEAGLYTSLGTAHQFDLGSLSSGSHTLTISVDNRMIDVNFGPMSHSVTDHTQGNWNGVVGEISLQVVPKVYIKRLRIDPLYSKKTVGVTVFLNHKSNATISIKILDGSTSLAEKNFEINGEKAFIDIPVAGVLKQWNEFEPNLYSVEVTVTTDSGVDTKKETFGFRDAWRTGGLLSLNNHPIYLRGTLECCIFPLTGYPPTDVESWKRIIRICKAHGLNHIRFHSWTPPKAAFIAGDELGFYYQVECSSWANQGAEIGSGWPLDQWILEETHRVLADYGNHPSFLMMAYGNEPAGKNHTEWLRQWVADRRAEDNRRFYTTGAGWTWQKGSDFHSVWEPRIQHWGAGLASSINNNPPTTDFDWTEDVKKRPFGPIVSHEIGQWCVYPSFDEIPKYSGHLKARNFEIFQETARRNGLLDQSRDFVQASGKLQTLAYKHDIEAALRTPGFGGYQLLDLHDFPGQGTALVGVLDPFWDSKGYVTPEEYKRFSGPVVPLARFAKMIFTISESIHAKLELSHFGPESFTGLKIHWSLTRDGVIVAKGDLPPGDFASGKLHPLGEVTIPLNKVTAPAKLVFAIEAADHSFSNSWDLFVYPDRAPAISMRSDVVITKDFSEAIQSLNEGKRVLFLAHGQVANDPDRPLAAGFSPMFWNTAWTDWQAPHTLGILCDPKHPALAHFPTDFHSNWNWWELQKDAQPFILTEHHDLKPIVQIIDDWTTNRKLGYLFEAQVGNGKLLACASDIESNLDTRYAARQYRQSLLAYINGTDFKPDFAISAAELQHFLGVHE